MRWWPSTTINDTRGGRFDLETASLQGNYQVYSSNHFLFNPHDMNLDGVVAADESGLFFNEFKVTPADRSKPSTQTYWSAYTGFYLQPEGVDQFRLGLNAFSNAIISTQISRYSTGQYKLDGCAPNCIAALEFLPKAFAEQSSRQSLPFEVRMILDGQQPVIEQVLFDASSVTELVMEQRYPSLNEANQYRYGRSQVKYVNVKLSEPVQHMQPNNIKFIPNNAAFILEVTPILASASTYLNASSAGVHVAYSQWSFKYQLANNLLGGDSTVKLYFDEDQLAMSVLDRAGLGVSTVRNQYQFSSPLHFVFDTTPPQATLFSRHRYTNASTALIQISLNEPVDLASSPLSFFQIQTTNSVVQASSIRISNLKSVQSSRVWNVELDFGSVPFAGEVMVHVRPALFTDLAGLKSGAAQIRFLHDRIPPKLTQIQTDRAGFNFFLSSFISPRLINISNNSSRNYDVRFKFDNLNHF